MSNTLEGREKNLEDIMILAGVEKTSCSQQSFDH